MGTRAFCMVGYQPTKVFPAEPDDHLEKSEGPTLLYGVSIPRGIVSAAFLSA